MNILSIEKLNDELNRYCRYEDNIVSWCGDLFGSAIPDELRNKIINSEDDMLIWKMENLTK